jgi:hypothetical protein
METVALESLVTWLKQNSIFFYIPNIMIPIVIIVLILVVFFYLLSPPICLSGGGVKNYLSFDRVRGPRYLIHYKKLFGKEVYMFGEIHHAITPDSCEADLDEKGMNNTGIIPIAYLFTQVLQDKNTALYLEAPESICPKYKFGQQIKCPPRGIISSLTASTKYMDNVIPCDNRYRTDALKFMSICIFLDSQGYIIHQDEYKEALKWSFNFIKNNTLEQLVTKLRKDLRSDSNFRKLYSKLSKEDHTKIDKIIDTKIYSQANKNDYNTVRDNLIDGKEDKRAFGPLIMIIIRIKSYFNDIELLMRLIVETKYKRIFLYWGEDHIKQIAYMIEKYYDIPATTIWNTTPPLDNGCLITNGMRMPIFYKQKKP